MKKGQSLQKVSLGVEEKQQLESMAASRALPHGIVQRAQIILLSAQGMNDMQIAATLGISRITVGTWRRRFIRDGIPGLHDEIRPGRPRTYDDEYVAELINQTLHTQPQSGTHWSCRSMAKETACSKSTVGRIWNAFYIQPHLQKHFKLSNDPFFVEKVRDIVGLYLNPPDKALVLCVDEKSQIQALNRTQPMLPLGMGYLEGVTRDYKRNGTTTLFAALNIASGTVIHKCKPRHRHQEFLSFLRQIDANVPPDLDIHLIVDNYATHKHPKVKLWLAQRPRYHVHYTPTYSSWLNQVERWFGFITQKAIRRGSFHSVKDLCNKIDTFVENYNQNPKPFAWTATADSILEKITRLCKRISGTQHYVAKIIYEVAERYDFSLEALAVMPDHAHLFVSAPPDVAAAQVVQTVKSITAREVFKRFPGVKKHLWGGALWERGYFVMISGEGTTDEMIRRYIKEQQGETSSNDQPNLFG